MAYSYVIDVSRWQGAIDHAAVARAGISGCVIKASEGLKANTTAVTRDYFRTHAPAAKKAYPLWGAYHYLAPGAASNAAAQVAWFIEQLQAVGGYEGAIIQLDAEDHGGGTPVLTVADVKAWKQAWDTATGGYPVLLYAPRWYWSQVAGYTALAGLGFAGWWASAYVTGSGDYLGLASKISAGWNAFAGMNPAIVQYSQQGRIQGIKEDVDLNEIRMPLADFRRLTTRSKEDELSAEFEARAKAQLDALYDAVVGGAGGAWKTGALPVLLARIAAEAKTRDDLLLATVKSIAQNAGIGDAGVQRIIDAVEGNREAARQSAADAATAAFAAWMDAAAKPTV